MTEPSQLEGFGGGSASADGEVLGRGAQTPQPLTQEGGEGQGEKSGLISANSRAGGPS